MMTSQGALRMQNARLKQHTQLANDELRVFFFIVNYRRLVALFLPAVPPQAIHLLKQLLSAVGFLHQNGVIHRDVKPENILVDTRNEGSPVLKASKRVVGIYRVIGVRFEKHPRPGQTSDLSVDQIDHLVVPRPPL